MSADAAALRRLVQAVAACCSGSGGLRFYTTGTEQFQVFVDGVARGTLAYLDHLPTGSDEPLRLAVLRRFWGVLHSLAQPVADADTLSTPVAITHLLERAAVLGSGKQAGVVLLHSPELNYFEHSRSRFRAIYEQLQGSVPDLPAFPENLCLVGIPFSQARQYLANICLFHEVGHFLAEDRGLHRQMEVRVTAEARGMAVEPEAVSWCADRLRSWTEEIFCDLFAVRWIGPAYVFAFAHVMELLGVLGSHFGTSHPAVGLRLGLQRQQLERDGWWDKIREIEFAAEAPSPYFTLVEQASAAPEDYEFHAMGHSLPVIVTALGGMLGDVSTILERSFPMNRGAAAALFQERWPKARMCLANAIVPSAVFEH